MKRKGTVQEAKTVYRKSYKKRKKKTCSVFCKTNARYKVWNGDSVFRSLAALVM